MTNVLQFNFNTVLLRIGDLTFKMNVLYFDVSLVFLFLILISVGFLLVDLVKVVNFLVICFKFTCNVMFFLVVVTLC